MQLRFEGIDFEGSPAAGAEMRALIAATAERIFGASLSREQLEVLTLCLSKRYGGNMKNITLEVRETFGEDGEEKHVQELLVWIGSELPRAYAEALARHGAAAAQPKGEALLEKRDKAPSILDRVVVRADAPALPGEPVGDAAPKKAKRDPSRTRCVHWPACKNPDCAFVHPKENVNSSVSKISGLSLRQQMSVHAPSSKYR